ncbi:hypothetical protein DFJ74DRAFT_698473 [Hyaloraphidium curvatum]|nr:hypothetical protein DFJ74DRAFT_698473 [Hyaloraphidium curvatum]
MAKETAKKGDLHRSSKHSGDLRRKKGAGNRNDDPEADVATLASDERFRHILRDPRFKKLKKDRAKVDIDERFSKMLDSEEFGHVAKVDKYGRKLKQKKGDDLRRYYKLDKSEPPGKTREREADAGLIDSEDEEEAEQPQKEWDRARGEGPMYSSSEDEEEEAEEASSDGEGSLGGAADDLVEFEEDDVYDRIGPFANEDIPMGDETRRLAVVNLDWDNLKARDLYKALASFKPPDGRVVSVKIYPSEFGKERMALELEQGPPAEIFGAGSAGKDDVGTAGETDVDATGLIQADAGEEFDNEKLRVYQLERLRYYYAIVECDSVSTAKAIYDACDGSEFEKTSNFLDLRYVPDEEEFADDPTDVADDNPAGYKPVDFVTKALQHSKVELTWDQDSTERVKTTRRRFTKDDLAEMDFQAYLGSDSEEDEADEETKKKYREMLLGGLEDGQDEEAEEMEITFAPGLDGKLENSGNDKPGRGAAKDKKGRSKRQETAKDDAGDGPELAEPDLGFDDPFFLDAEDPKAAKKRAKESKKKKDRHAPDDGQSKARAELELLLADESGAAPQHFDMKEILKEEKRARRKKGRKGKDKTEAADSFEIDVNDPRFAPMLSSGAFAIDTTSSNFKDTTNMRKLLEARKSRASGSGDKWTVTESEQRPDDIKALVANVKRKAAVNGGSNAPAKKQRQ